MSAPDPLVSVVTPVYNGGGYLTECIDSVLRQQYRNWEYIIVNNCSIDSTCDIATRYAALDPRIRVVNNSVFVGAIENHNIAFSLISPESKYCKVVSADDWIYPECIMRMVEVAEENPSVGIVGSYQLSGDKVKWQGLPHDVRMISGREACRRTLLENLDVFGTPTSSLYRSDLVRGSKPFFPHTRPHADTSACYKYLQYSDFGFVHEILSIERIHEGQWSSKVKRLNMGNVANIEYLLEYGPNYLTGVEFEPLKSEFFKRYYRGLGGCVLKLEGKQFWRYHISRMEELGHPIRWRKVMKGVMDEILDETKNPKVAFYKLLVALRKKYPDELQRKL